MDQLDVPMSRDSLFKYNHHPSTNISAEILGQPHQCYRFIPSFTLNVMSLLKDRQVQEDKQVKWFRFVLVIELFLVDKGPFILKFLSLWMMTMLKIQHCDFRSKISGLPVVVWRDLCVSWGEKGIMHSIILILFAFWLLNKRPLLLPPLTGAWISFQHYCYSFNSRCRFPNHNHSVGEREGGIYFNTWCLLRVNFNNELICRRCHFLLYVLRHVWQPYLRVVIDSNDTDLQIRKIIFHSLLTKKSDSAKPD